MFKLKYSKLLTYLYSYKKTVLSSTLQFVCNLHYHQRTKYLQFDWSMKLQYIAYLKKFKKNYKFAPPTILPAPPLAQHFTQCIEMVKNLLLVLKNPTFYRIVFLLAHISKKTVKKPNTNRVNEEEPWY